MNDWYGRLPSGHSNIRTKLGGVDLEWAKDGLLKHDPSDPNEPFLSNILGLIGALCSLCRPPTPPLPLPPTFYSF